MLVSILLLSIFAIVYSYVLFPALLYFINKLSRSSAHDNGGHNEYSLPTVAVVIAAYNEEAHIKDRIENLLQLEYPEDKIKFYIGSDGSDDSTNQIASSYTHESVVFFPFQERRGKASVLNDLASRVNEDVIVFSDANTDFKLDAIILLVEKFIDADVGGVCGELQILSRENNDNLDSLYWRYERFIKENEGKIDALLGANGAIYAIRKSLFQPIPADTITDDFYIGMMVVKQGFKFLYQPKAIAYEYEPENHSDEFRRRVRIGMGNYQAFARLSHFLNPFTYGRYFFTYFSHKVLRWFTPHLMVLIFVISLLLAGEPLFFMLLLMQIVIYVFCWFAYKNIAIKSLPRLFSLLVFFVSMNFALLIGSIKYLTQKANPAWQRTAR